MGNWPVPMSRLPQPASEAGSILKHTFSSFPLRRGPRALVDEKRETAKPVGRARTEIFLFCTSSDPTWVNVIDLDGQRVRGLLRGRTVESRTLRRCRSLGREGECTGEIFATSAGPFSAASKSVATVFFAEKSQRILLASVFPYIPPIPVPLLPYSPAPVLSSPKPRNVWECR